MAMNRRTFLLALGGAAAGCAIGAPAYAWRFEPNWLELTHRRARLGGTPRARPIRLLHLSDLHASDTVPLPFIERALRMGLAEEPDLICLTGDFITGRFDLGAGYRRVLSLAAGAAPTYACLGNHDGGAWVAHRGGYRDTQPISQFLRDCGIQCLVNEAHTLRVRDEALALAGIGDFWTEYFEPRRAFSGLGGPDRPPVVVLAHNPDIKDEIAGEAWDLMLSGHTHGGQVRLPLLGTPFAPVKDLRFVAGMYDWNGRRLHITRGVGNLHGVRFNCRPEVSVVDLV
jgi:predicted MPP superfamily phosphohydrolase